jgi:hypothetical protein
MYNLRVPADNGNGKEGRFKRTLEGAVKLYERPRVAVVARTPERADYIYRICLATVADAGAVDLYVDDEASDALAKTPHQIAVLDSSLAAKLRSGLARIARETLRGCTVIQIRKWSQEPPA